MPPFTPSSYSGMLLVLKYLAACHIEYDEAAMLPYVGRLGAGALPLHLFHLSLEPATAAHCGSVYVTAIVAALALLAAPL